ncbi:MAG: family 20 glycosylhydrolase [Bacteroidaceae bacterium]
MRSKTLFFVLVVAIISVLSGCTSSNWKNEYTIVPQPNFLLPQDGHYVLTTSAAAILSQPLTLESIDLLANFHVDTVDSMKPEAYHLDVTPTEIHIKSATAQGSFYALQSLKQLMRNHVNSNVQDTTWYIPCTTIEDVPRFVYRGMHLDVSRHFYNVAFIKKQLDAMSRYKLNRFHWHLTDGAGWRIQIDKYPKLTTIAAWRPIADWTDYWEHSDRHFCTQDTPDAYGGYYTHDDIKEVIKYAQDRGITIIPEIEMPGHSEEVLAVYPELSCSGQPYINSVFCAGREETFTFLENVLSEVIELFPSQYIHIGGDEASKTAWAQCPRCQRRMAKEGLTTEEELQSYFIKRIEKFLTSKGRKLLGWDEILQGGLAPDATVMSWRGTEGGIEALKSGHKTIMTPVNFCYFDYYQDAPASEPEAFGGYLPLSKVYSYNPLPEGLSIEQSNNLLGVQGNVWSEHLPTYEHTEYMIYPRLLAMAEIGWTEVKTKDYTRFKKNVLKEIEYLRSQGYHTFDLKNATGSRMESRQPVATLALNAPITYVYPYSDKYKAGGDSTLVDGHLGDWTYLDGCWQGFLNQDVDVTIDLKEQKTIHTIHADFMQLAGNWVWLPQQVIISVSSDNESFTDLAQLTHDISTSDKKQVFHSFGWQGETRARYIRYHAINNGTKGGFLFTDEIVVN